MNQQLIPIIAAYWGCECSYESVFKGVSYTEQIHLNEYAFHTILYQNFKLHLRPLWSITEDELRELAKITNTRYELGDLPSESEMKKWASRVLNGDCDLSIPIINHLRAKGFCLDQELVDAGLVEWKEVTP